MTPLTFTVYGIAQSKGSTRAFVPKGWTRPIVTDNNPKVKGWQQLVAEGASKALEAAGGETPDRAGAVKVSIGFYLPRPKKYQRRGLAVSHLTKPDVDKLTRGVLDALTGVVWDDDSHVTELAVTKAYADLEAAPRVDVRVESTSAVIHQPLFRGSATHATV